MFKQPVKFILKKLGNNGWISNFSAVDLNDFSIKVSNVNKFYKGNNVGNFQLQICAPGLFQSEVSWYGKLSQINRYDQEIESSAGFQSRPERRFCA